MCSSEQALQNFAVPARPRRRVPPTRRTAAPALHRGFTLVEMLVAVALVMLLMSLFAQVFQMAGGSVSKQRGLMENDQKARSVQTLMAGDLRKRTFRRVIPYTFNENLATSEADLPNRRGYFSISENEPFNDADDVLSLTVDARITIESRDAQKYYGRALPLAPAALSPVQQYLYYLSNLNQPETDDGLTELNFSAVSSAAEVSYFLRNGNLYRRVLLLREPNPAQDDDQPRDDQPGNSRFFARDYEFPAGSGNYFIYPTGGGNGGFANATCFWHDFDYSAHPALATVTSSGSVSAYVYDGAEFNGLGSLTLNLPPNTFQSSNDFVGGIPKVMAYPPNRFGCNTINPAPLLSGGSNLWLSPLGGQPREYGAGGFWVGRLTAEETSRSTWTYPQLTHVAPNGVNDPQNPLNAVTAWTDSNGDYVVDGLNGGDRRGEDLVLSNVYSFDIKVWDDVLGDFADIGHTRSNAAGVFGDYHINRRLNNVYGPTGSTSRMFDTWYPFRHKDADGNGSFDPAESSDTDSDGVVDPLPENISGNPDRQTLDFDADGQVTRFDQLGDGLIDAGENFPPFRPLHALPTKGNTIGGGGSADNFGLHFERFVPGNGSGSRYQVGDRVFPSKPFVKNSLQWGDPFYYICTAVADRNGNSTTDQGVGEPVWPRVAGLSVTDGDLTWQAVENRKPLRAIQITLRYLDPSTQQVRTLTIQHSLID